MDVYPQNWPKTFFVLESGTGFDINRKSWLHLDSSWITREPQGPPERQWRQEMGKPVVTILVDEQCRPTPEVLPYWQFCQNLGVKLNQRRNVGDISLKFSTDSFYFQCEFRWRGKYVCALQFPVYVGPLSQRVVGLTFTYTDQDGYQLDETWLYRNIFRPTIHELVAREIETLKTVLLAIPADLRT